MEGILYAMTTRLVFDYLFVWIKYFFQKVESDQPLTQKLFRKVESNQPLPEGVIENLSPLRPQLIIKYLFRKLIRLN